MKKYLLLMLSFLKLGAFTFGGGYAMIPLIEKDIVTKLQLISEEEMLDIIAVSESTPGPLAINCATFIGYKVGKFLGALIATISVVLPSFIIILVISMFVDQFLAFEYVQYAFMGIRIAVAILICEAAIKMFMKSKKDIMFYVLFFIALILSLFFTSINPAFIILGGGLVGLVYGLIYHKVKKGDEE